MHPSRVNGALSLTSEKRAAGPCPFTGLHRVCDQSRAGALGAEVRPSNHNQPQARHPRGPAVSPGLLPPAVPKFFSVTEIGTSVSAFSLPKGRTIGTKQVWPAPWVAKVLQGFLVRARPSPADYSQRGTQVSPLPLVLPSQSSALASTARCVTAGPPASSLSRACLPQSLPGSHPTGHSLGTSCALSSGPTLKR